MPGMDCGLRYFLRNNIIHKCCSYPGLNLVPGSKSEKVDKGMMNDQPT